MFSNKYTFFGFIDLLLNKILTFFLFKNARIVRRPFYIRGKSRIDFGQNLTTGVGLRMDAFSFDKNNLNKHLIIIGKNVQFNDYVHIAATNSIIIENNVLIASKVFITDHNHGSYSLEDSDSPDIPPVERKIVSSHVLIKENTWIGEFVSILPGVTIGKGCIIGANSCVTKSIPDYSIAVGSPAKIIKSYNFQTKSWTSCE